MQLLWLNLVTDSLPALALAPSRALVAALTSSRSLVAVLTLASALASTAPALLAAILLTARALVTALACPWRLCPGFLFGLPVARRFSLLPGLVFGGFPLGAALS